MSLTTTTVRYGSDRESGYFAHPARAKTPLPAVLVLQEIWGVDAHIEDVTRRFASAGYAALAPDLFSSGGERRPDLTRERVAEAQAFLNTAPPAVFGDPKAREAALASRPEAERPRIEATMSATMAYARDPASLVPRLLAATSWLRSECGVTRGQKIAALGFCLGGSLSANLACHDPELAAAVIFYGGPPPADLISKIACPVLGLYGSLDQRLIPQLPAFEQAMKSAGKPLELVVYEGAGHAFFNDNRPSYDAPATRDSFVRTLELLRKELATEAR
jgi:carboxymethylenebutenolidase